VTNAFVRPMRKGPLGQEPFAVLTVGLDHRAADSIRRYSATRQWIYDHVRSGREALGYLRMTSDRPPAIILCADILPDGSWRQLLEWVSCGLIVISRGADERLWAEVLNLGACDLLSDPFTTSELKWSIDSARLAWERAHVLLSKHPLERAAAK
jgi:DNA-binding response OmpR family regulator